MYQVALAILHHIPEGMLVFSSGLMLTRSERPWRLVALLGVVYGLTLTLARGLLPLGYHIPVVIAASFALFMWGAQLPLGKAAFAATLTFVIIGMGGVLVSAPVLTALGVEYELALASAPWGLIGAWLEDSLLVAVLLVLLWRQRSLPRKQ